MNPNEAIKSSIDIADMISKSYLEDLTDEEMMHRPADQCNHIKWQLGHLIGSDFQMVNGCCEGVLPALPDGFVDKYTKETASSDAADAFHSKAELMDLFQQQRSAVFAALEKLTPEDLDQPTPEAMQSYAPTVGSAFAMLGIHWTMHSGQWAVIRRQLGRAPLF